MRKISIIGVLIIVFIVKELAWLCVIPPSEAPDEAGHYGYIESLYNERKLPMLGSIDSKKAALFSENDLAQKNDTGTGALRNLSVYQFTWITQHPPLYYFLLLPMYAVLPHENIAFSFFVLRFLSILLAAGTLYFIYKTFKKIAPQNKLMPLAVTGAVAFLPTFSFISATINNDNLVIFLSSILIYLLVKNSDTIKYSIKLCVTIGVLLGLLALTKMTALPIFFVVLLVLTVGFIRTKDRHKRNIILLSSLIIFAIPFLLAGWWYIRNKLTFGTFFPSLKDAVILNPQILKVFPSLITGFPEISPSAEAKMSLYDFFITQNFFVEYYKIVWGAFGRLTLLTVWQYAAIFVFSILAVFGYLKNLFVKRRVKQNLLAKIGAYFGSAQGILFFTFFTLLFFLTIKIFEISTLRGFLGAMQGRYFLVAAPALFYFLLRGWERLVPKTGFEITAKVLIVLFIINDMVSLINIVIPNFY